MKKILPVFLALTSLSAFSQVVDGRIGFSTSAYEAREGRERDNGVVRALPVTIDVTRMISPSEFESKTDVELKASLADFTYLDRVNDGQRAKVYLGVGGELLSFDRQRIFLKDGVSSFSSLELLRVEGIALFSLDDKVYLQVNAHVSLGAPLNGQRSGLFTVPDSYVREFLDEGQCLGCNSQPDWRDADSLVRSGTNVEIRYKNLSLNLYHNRTYTSQTSGWRERRSEALPEGVTMVDSYVTNHFKQNNVGFIVTYNLQRDGSSRGLAIFAGLNATTVAKAASGRSSVYLDDSRFNERIYHGGNLNPTYDIDVHKTGFVTVGVRANINGLFKKKK